MTGTATGLPFTNSKAWGQCSVGLPVYRRFFSGYSGIPPSLKPTTSGIKWYGRLVSIRILFLGVTVSSDEAYSFLAILLLLHYQYIKVFMQRNFFLAFYEYMLKICKKFYSDLNAFIYEW